jgi:cytochrome bd ubiquinol oxidase subunit II
MDEYTTLQVVWFLLISILWIGYFVLEGFDFGVGMLMRVVGRTHAERRAVMNSIGPVWDGNEVWLLVAGGATFAAFPQWYATLFSGFYLALFLILVALIVRNVSFEFWGKGDSDAWRTRWEWTMAVGSVLPALLWGVAWANIVHGVPIDRHGEFTGTLFTLLKPYALLGGLATLTLFLTHGAIFLSLRTTGAIEERARAIAVRVAPVAAACVIGFLVWTLAAQDGVEAVSAVLAVGAVALVLAAAALVASAPARAFAATCGAIALFFCALFADLFPHAMVSSTNATFSLTLNEAASSSYTLTVMTVVAVLLVPVVLLYQGWTYWVFRKRISAEDFGEVRTPIDLLSTGEHRGGGSTEA